MEERAMEGNERYKAITCKHCLLNCRFKEVVKQLPENLRMQFCLLTFDRATLNRSVAVPNMN